MYCKPYTNINAVAVTVAATATATACYSISMHGVD